MARADSTSITRRAAFRLASAAALTTLTITQAPADDSELIALGREVERLNGEIEAAADRSDHLVCDALCKQGEKLVKQIFEFSADTLEGLQVKCIALIWCHGDDRDMWDDVNTYDLVKDIMALKPQAGA